MATLAKAYVQIVPSAQGIKEGIKKEIDPDGLGKSVGASLGASIKTAIAAAGIGMAVKKIFPMLFQTEANFNRISEEQRLYLEILLQVYRNRHPVHIKTWGFRHRIIWPQRTKWALFFRGPDYLSRDLLN